MIEEKVFLFDTPNYFTYYSKDSFDKPLVVVVPGGGYDHTSKREAFNVADKFLNLGLNACVLNYRETLDQYPFPQKCLAYTIDYMRKNKKKYHIISDKVLVIGFSAGSHLALCNAIYYKEYGYESRPNLLALCYPVISSDKDIMHVSSFNYLLNNKMNEKMLDKLSLEKHITNDLCDVFLWHTFTDESVNVMNSLKLAIAFKEKNINTELHIFPRGAHGMSLADDSMTTGGKYLKDDYVAKWFDLFVSWLRLKKFINK